jgi:SAM-dependent methyltransferase
MGCGAAIASEHYVYITPLCEMYRESTLQRDRPFPGDDAWNLLWERAMAQKDAKDLFADGHAYEHYVGRWSRPVGHLFLHWLSQPLGLCWAEVGCGTGALTGMVLQEAEPKRVIGVEPSEGFLRVAREAIKDPRAELKSGDAQSLPIDNHAVHVVISGLVLNFVPDKPRALAEMCRIVKPGGVIAAYVWDYAGEMQLMRYFWNAVTDLFPEGAAHDEGRQFPICKPEPLAALFRHAGLREIATCALDAPTVFADFDDYWSPFLRGQGPAGVYCVSLSEQNRERLRAHLEDTLPVNADGTISLMARAWAVQGKI